MPACSMTADSANDKRARRRAQSGGGLATSIRGVGGVPAWAEDLCVREGDPVGSGARHAQHPDVASPHRGERRRLPPRLTRLHGTPLCTSPDQRHGQNCRHCEHDASQYADGETLTTQHVLASGEETRRGGRVTTSPSTEKKISNRFSL